MTDLPHVFPGYFQQELLEFRESIDILEYQSFGKIINKMYDQSQTAAANLSSFLSTGINGLAGSIPSLTLDGSGNFTGTILNNIQASFSPPVAGSANVGNGTMGSIAVFPLYTVSETWTITAITAGPPATFSVVGSVSGAQGTATAGTLFLAGNSALQFLISTGSTNFAIGDTFTITTVATPILNQKFLFGFVGVTINSFFPFNYQTSRALVVIRDRAVQAGMYKNSTDYSNFMSSSNLAATCTVSLVGPNYGSVQLQIANASPPVLGGGQTFRVNYSMFYPST